MGIAGCIVIFFVVWGVYSSMMIRRAQKILPRLFGNDVVGIDELLVALRQRGVRISRQSLRRLMAQESALFDTIETPNRTSKGGKIMVRKYRRKFGLSTFMSVGS